MKQKQVSKAQLAELDLAQGLTGNPAVDLKAVATMETDFAGGIVQNMKNQQAVSSTPYLTKIQFANASKATQGCPQAAPAAGATMTSTTAPATKKVGMKA